MITLAIANKHKNTKTSTKIKWCIYVLLRRCTTNECMLFAKNWHSFKVMRATYCGVIWHFRNISEFNRDLYFIVEKKLTAYPTSDILYVHLIGTFDYLMWYASVSTYAWLSGAELIISTWYLCKNRVDIIGILIKKNQNDF